MNMSLLPLRRIVDVSLLILFRSRRDPRVLEHRAVSLTNAQRSECSKLFDLSNHASRHYHELSNHTCTLRTHASTTWPSLLECQGTGSSWTSRDASSSSISLRVRVRVTTIWLKMLDLTIEKGDSIVSKRLDSIRYHRSSGCKVLV